MRLAIGVTLAGFSCPTVETARETRHPQAGEPFFGEAARYAGNGPEYVDNGDGTVTDRATGLVRMQVGGGHLEAGPESDGRSDWRLPNAGELQGIVDHARCPDATRSATIDPLFELSSIEDGGGKRGFPSHRRGTTHASAAGGPAA